MSPFRTERAGAALYRFRWQVPLVLAFIATCMAAWGTSAALSAKAGLWLMLVLDFLAFPVGIVDGFGIWLRLW